MSEHAQQENDQANTRRELTSRRAQKLAVPRVSTWLLGKPAHNE